MGSSLGCVKQPRDIGPGGAHPLSPKRKLRFRRKRKGKKAQKGVEAEAEKKIELGKFSLTGEVVGGPADDASNKLASSKSLTETPTQVVLVPGVAPILGSTGTLRGSRVAILSPAPSPAWTGAVYQGSDEKPTEQFKTKDEHGSMTPGGGRVCRVQGRVQGILERPCILSAKSGELGPEDKDKGSPSELLVDDASEKDQKGIVHIREVDGRLCVVRTVYPRDYGSPLWHNRGVEVHSEPPAASPVIGGIQKVQMQDERRKPSTDTGVTSPTIAVGQPEKGFMLDSHTQGADSTGPLQDPHSSGYASDVPITSPDIAGTAPTDWGSSSEVLNTSILESPISPPEKSPQPPSKCSRFVHAECDTFVSPYQKRSGGEITAFVTAGLTTC
ncbi:uncharacterized protein Hap1MRO34_004215 [Clarias gariepinus]